MTESNPAWLKHQLEFPSISGGLGRQDQGMLDFLGKFPGESFHTLGSQFSVLGALVFLLKEVATFHVQNYSTGRLLPEYIGNQIRIGDSYYYISDAATSFALSGILFNIPLI